MTYERTKENPLIAQGGVATGRQFITLCCTSSVKEFRLPDGGLWLIGTVAGHGYGKPWKGSVDDINDDGTKVDADGTERRVYWRPGKDD